MPRFEPLDTDSLDLIKTCCAPEMVKRNGYVYCDGYMMPGIFIKEAEELTNFEVYDDDIWVSSFPKSGTTWTQEMVWCVLNSDEESVHEKLADRFPFIELIAKFAREYSPTTTNELCRMSQLLADENQTCFKYEYIRGWHSEPHKNSFNFLINKEKRKVEDPEFYNKLMGVVSYQSLSERPRPRYIKTHLPFDLLPSKLQHEDCKAKIIYVIRNPRDACISLYHQKKAHRGFDGTLEQFAELFIKDLVTYGPYWKSVLSYWNQRHRSNILIIKFEDMKKDLSEVLHRVGEFLGKPLTTERIAQLCHHLNFDTMKNNPSVNSITLSTWLSTKKVTNGTPGPAASDQSDADKKSHASNQLLRSGKVNQWKETINDELKENFEKWEMANLKNTDFPLNYDV